MNPYRNLPAVHVVQALLDDPLAVAAVRVELDRCRERLTAGEPFDASMTAEAIAARVRLPRYQSVINATGIVLHTNLGRAPLAPEAVAAASMAAAGYLNLELDLLTGKRAHRQAPITTLLQHLTHAEAGTVVNNCAAATVLTLAALAAGKEVIVSRGELVEIGGSFRIPDIMQTAGVTLREVGTTNITRVSDYARAIGPNTALIMRIHPSNYRIRGFTSKPDLSELIGFGIPVIDDVGSGALHDFGGDEPIVPESIAAGANVVLFSGDKLLGGPQAGIIVGRRASIDRLESHPLFRAFRCDKMTLAALEATLRLHADPERAKRELPTWAMLSRAADDLRTQADTVATALGATTRAESGYVGGGSLADVTLAGTVIVLATPSAEALAHALRTGRPAVLARIHAGEVLLDLRTVPSERVPELIAAVRRGMATSPGTPISRSARIVTNP